MYDFQNHQVEISRSHKTVDHGHPHPNGTYAHKSWAAEQTLHVAVAFSNTRRWRTRINLFNDFRRHMAILPNVKLYVGELAYGDRPFEVTATGNPLDFQFRTDQELWHKENLLNAVINRFDPDWRYGAYVDGDFHFTRHDVALETIHMLQHHNWVQMFSTYCDLTHDHRPMRILNSFGARYVNGELTPEVLRRVRLGVPETEGAYYGAAMGAKKGLGSVGTTGAAWAFRRKAFEDVGGLLDICILGSSDWHMAFGLVGEPDTHPNTAEITCVNSRYAEAIKIWQARAALSTNKNVGVVNCHAVHYFHGSKVLRKYGERWKILRDHNFDPYTDLYRDRHGLYQLAPSKPGLRDAIRGYLQARNEDDISLRATDTILGT